MADSPWMHAQYTLRRQVFRLFGAGFEIFGPDGDSAFYSEQKAFRLKEDIRLFDSDQKQREELVIKTNAVVDFSAAYDVFDPVENEMVGALRRRGWKSMIADEWIILDPDGGEIGRIKEDNALLSLVRRTVANIVPQKFHAEVGGARVATYRQHFNPFIQKIDFDFSADTQNLLDRRLGLAAGVLLCAIEGRQE